MTQPPTRHPRPTLRASSRSASAPGSEPEPLVRDDAQRSSPRPGPVRTSLVVLPLLVGVAVAGGLGGRMLLQQSADPVAAADTVTCWDGSEAGTAGDCPKPRGTDGLARVFTSFRPAELACFDELERHPEYNRPAMWSCAHNVGGRPVRVTYSEVSARKAAMRFFDKLHGKDARGPVRTLPGGATAYRWAPGPTDDGSWEASMLLVEGPFAVTVRADLRSDAAKALERRVSVRPPQEWRADPGEDPATDS